MVSCHLLTLVLQWRISASLEVNIIISVLSGGEKSVFSIVFTLSSLSRLSNTTTNETRDVLHFHYTTWPDFGVPSCPDTFLEFLGAVREAGSLDSDVGPAVVHCSAGIGRSGSFILVDSCLLEAENAGPEVVNIKQRLLDMRSFRMGLIQTDHQLKFSYQAIIEVLRHFHSFMVCKNTLQGARQLGLISLVPSFEAVVPDASDSSDEDESPPPLPPRRIESLMKKSSEEDDEVVEVVEVENKKIIIADAEPYNSIYNSVLKQPLVNGNINGVEADGSASSSGSSAVSTNSSSETSPNKCILTNNKLEEKKRY